MGRGGRAGDGEGVGEGGEDGWAGEVDGGGEGRREVEGSRGCGGDLDGYRGEYEGEGMGFWRAGEVGGGRLLAGGFGACFLARSRAGTEIYYKFLACIIGYCGIRGSSYLKNYRWSEPRTLFYLAKAGLKEKRSYDHAWLKTVMYFKLEEQLVKPGSHRKECQEFRANGV